MVDHTDSGEVERLIHRVRTMIDLGLTLDEIVEQCDDVRAGEVGLAYHAAKILIDDGPDPFKGPCPSCPAGPGQGHKLSCPERTLRR